MRINRTVCIAVAAALLLAACGGDGGSGGDASPSASVAQGDRPSSSAELRIVSPENGDVVRGSTVDLRVDLNGATIVPQTTMDIAPDEGHLHVLLDDQLISMTEGLEQTVPGVEPGSHRITVEFVAADHVYFEPRVVAVVAFEVRP